MVILFSHPKPKDLEFFSDMNKMTNHHLFSLHKSFFEDYKMPLQKSLFFENGQNYGYLGSVAVLGVEPGLVNNFREVMTDILSCLLVFF